VQHDDIGLYGGYDKPTSVESNIGLVSGVSHSYARAYSCVRGIGQYETQFNIFGLTHYVEMAAGTNVTPAVFARFSSATLSREKITVWLSIEDVHTDDGRGLWIRLFATKAANIK